MRRGAFGPTALVLMAVLAVSACGSDDKGSPPSGAGQNIGQQPTGGGGDAGKKSLAGIPLCDLVSDKTLASMGLTRQDGKEKERGGGPSCYYDKKVDLTVRVDLDSAMSAKHAPKGTRESGGVTFGIVYESDTSCQLYTDVAKGEKAEAMVEDLEGGNLKAKACDITIEALKDMLAKAK